MNAVRQICHCGHDIDTHFESKHACLGMGCDDCKSYRDALAPDPTVRKKPVHPDRWRDGYWWNDRRMPAGYEPCQCYECKQAGP